MNSRSIILSYFCVLSRKTKIHSSSLLITWNRTSIKQYEHVFTLAKHKEQTQISNSAIHIKNFYLNNEVQALITFVSNPAIKNNCRSYILKTNYIIKTILILICIRCVVYQRVWRCVSKSLF